MTSKEIFDRGYAIQGADIRADIQLVVTEHKYHDIPKEVFLTHRTEIGGISVIAVAAYAGKILKKTQR